MKLTSKNVENNENLRFDNSGRPDWPSTGPRKLRTIFPHTSVVSKPPQSQDGATKTKLGRIFDFPVFTLSDTYLCALGMFPGTT